MHLLHAEFLEASGADEAAAARARCLSYKVTAEAPQYAEHFAGEAARALQHVAAAGGGAESAETLRAAAGLVEMAECIREGSAAQARAALDYYRVAVDHMGGAQRGVGGGGRGAGWRFGFLSHSPSAGAPPPSSLRRTRFAPVVAGSADGCAIAGRARGASAS